MRPTCLSGAAVLALALSLLCPATASAQALSAPGVGTSASGPATVDPAAVFWNPAALAFLEKTTILASGGLILGDVRYQRERRGVYQREDSLDFKQPISPSSIDASKTGRAADSHATPFAPVGSFFAAMPLTDRVTAGLGVYAPYAALLDFGAGGAQRWALSSATIASLYVTPAIAFRPVDNLSIGAGVSYVFGFAELAKTQDFAGIPDVGTALARPPISQANDFGPNATTGVRELSTMARPIKLQKMVANSFTFNVGVSYKPTPAVLLGLSYQHSTPMHFNGKFSLDMNADFFTRDLASQGLAYKPIVEGDATLSFTLPRSLLAGASVEATDRIRLTLNAVYTWWSQVKTFDVAARSPDLAQPKLGLPDNTSISLIRDWKNTIGLEGTVRAKVTDDLALWLTGGYHSSAVPDATIDVASPDGDRIVGAVGGGYQLSERWSLMGDFKMQRILPRTVVASTNDLGNGTYNLAIYSLMAHVLAQF
jgi:long-chain fatty acid transport protein